VLLNRQLQHLCLGLAAFFITFTSSQAATTATDATEWFLQGEYEKVIKVSKAEIENRSREDTWTVLLVRALLETGQYSNAVVAFEQHQYRFSSSMELRWYASEAAKLAGQTQNRSQILSQIAEYASSQSRRGAALRNTTNTIFTGRAFLALGADPSQILKNLYEKAKKEAPKSPEIYLAIGELALAKEDFALAAKTFLDGLKADPKNPYLHLGAARAFAPSDRKECVTHLIQALDINPRMVQATVLMAEQMIDSEDYENADKALETALETNPHYWEALASKAVIAFLKNNEADVKRFRQAALKWWGTNPEVDHLIGKKISQRYRFQEGSEFQKSALMLDKNFLPAKTQLAQDLLRLGDEEAGWKLANEVFEQDGYNVSAFNLVELQDKLNTYATLTNEYFILRMMPVEAKLYGADVLSLLTQARETLCKKYGFEVSAPVVVEIFADPNDFGVRTFGMPENPGYLGVCFGKVITANSPAAQKGTPSNWKAVLWHEFCHVVTLQQTGNRIPRWLSEGISVYEEKQLNKSWGQHFNPNYREMVFTKLTPVSKLSSAFLTAKDGAALQFAYFESCLVVEFLVEKFGIEKLKNVLNDMKLGKSINQALSDHTLPIEKLDDQFKEYAEAEAKKFGSGLKFDKPEMTLAALEKQGFKPDEGNYFMLMQLARAAYEKKNYPEAEKWMLKILEGRPEVGPHEVFQGLTKLYEKTGQTNEAVKIYRQWAEMDGAALEPASRLMKWSAMKNDKADLARYIEQTSAIDPVSMPMLRFKAGLHRDENQTSQAVETFEKLLLLEPPDIARVHFQLAQLLAGEDAGRAKRHLLQALELAPRLKEGYALLEKLGPNLPATKP